MYFASFFVLMGNSLFNIEVKYKYKTNPKCYMLSGDSQTINFKACCLTLAVIDLVNNNLYCGESQNTNFKVYYLTFAGIDLCDY